jgi:hypothetical protein
LKHTETVIRSQKIKGICDMPYTMHFGWGYICGAFELPSKSSAKKRSTVLNTLIGSALLNPNQTKLNALTVSKYNAESFPIHRDVLLLHLLHFQPFRLLF